MRIYKTKEYSKVEEDLLKFLSENGIDLKIKSKKHPEDDPEFLGLHYCKYENTAQCMKTSHFVGIVTIEDDIALVVESKIDELLPINMLLEVISHPVVSKELKYGKAYGYNFNKKPIYLDSNIFFLFLAISYIGLLYNISKKGLLKGYIKRKENLNSKIKGKIIYRKHFKTNVVKGKYNYHYCSFNTRTEDIIENRILKAAFIKVLKFINLLEHQKKIRPGVIYNISSLISFINLVFEKVATARVLPSDFRLITNQKIRPDYKYALKMAEKIFKNLGYDPEKLPTTENIPIYPYWIDMNELFERYCEVKIREDQIPDLKGFHIYPGYNRNNINTFIGSLRPDFILVKNDNWAIADAKYKDIYYKNNPDINDLKEMKDDLQQVALYGRIEVVKIKERFGIEKLEGNPYLYILCPCNCHNQYNNSIKIDKTQIEGFDIYKICVPIPK